MILISAFFYNLTSLRTAKNDIFFSELKKTGKNTFVSEAGVRDAQVQQQAKLPPGGLDWSQLAVPLLPPVCWTDLARRLLSVHREMLSLF